jgi:hypothetical protein
VILAATALCARTTAFLSPSNVLPWKMAYIHLPTAYEELHMFSHTILITGKKISQFSQEMLEGAA